MEVLMETKKAQPRFTEEFKIEAVKQVTEWGHAVAEVAVRLGVSAHSLYTWIKRYSVPAEQRAERDSQADEIRRLKAELRRVTEERDILKRPPRTLPSSPGEVRVHRRPRGAVPGASPVFDAGGASERLLRLEAAARLCTLGRGSARRRVDYAML